MISTYTSTEYKMRALAAVILCATTVFCAAQSAQQVYKDAETFYERANYEKAISKCIAALRIKDNHRKAQECLQLSWNGFFKQSMNEIRMSEVAASGLQGNEKVMKLQLIRDRYKRLIDARNECTSIPHTINKATGKPFDFGSQDFYPEWQAATDALKNASSLASEYHYERGLEFERLGDMANAKLAAREFKLANHNTPGFKDARSRYESNRTKATKRLAIIPFENSSGQTQYGAVQNMITDWVIASLMKDGDAMEFTNIVTRDELQIILAEHKLNMSSLLDENSVVESGALLGVHQVVTGRINQLAYEQRPDIRRQYVRNGQCWDGRTMRTVTGKDGKPRQEAVYTAASATITEHVREVKYRISGSFKILDVRSGQLLKGDSFTQELPWTHSWGTYTGAQCMTGDRNDKELLNRREQNPPSASELTNQAGQQLANYLAKQIASAIR